MFTGLVHELGRLSAPPETTAVSSWGASASADGDVAGVILRLAHGEPLSERLEIGASLAVSGVCLTLIEHAPGRSTVELSPETLARTTLGELVEGDDVNLEPALRAGDALGGHFVQGHVDGTIRCIERRDLGEHRELRFELPAAYATSVVEKGSVTLDGVSLTVSRLGDDFFETALIPHTLEVTNLDRLKPGTRVNFEIDVLAKYIQRALEARGRLPT